MRTRWAWAAITMLSACSGVGRGQATAIPWHDMPTPVGWERPWLDSLRDGLSSHAGLSIQSDAFGSLIVRRATGGSPGHVRLLVAVGIDEPGYVVSQIRDDGLLRLRTLATGATEAFHLAREGRPAQVGTRGQPVNGVVLVSSLHLRAPRPEVLDEAGLYLDVGADSQQDVADLGIELLAPVVMRESVRLAGDRTAGPSAGAREIARVLAECVAGAAENGSLAEDVAVAFVAQSQVGTPPTATKPGSGPLGRGGEGVVIRLQPETTMVVRVAEALEEATRRTGSLRGPESQWEALELRARDAGSFVELVDDADVHVLQGRVSELLGGGAPARIDPPPIGTPFAPADGPGPGDANEQREQDFGPTLPLLGALVRARGVSGHEGAVREIVRRELASIHQAWQPHEDPAGNLVLTLGEGAQTLAFIAHMDEIGLEVTRLREDGLLETKRLGGMFTHLFCDTAIELVTTSGRILSGVALPEPMDPESREPVILLDVGARSAAEAATLGVAVGDAATVPKELAVLGRHRAAGRSNDDRVGCAALLLALHELGPDADDVLRSQHRRVVFAWSTKEETGLEGADALARALRPVPDVVFAVDTFVTSDSPLEDPRYAHARLGGGPVLRALDNSSLTPFDVLDSVRRVAGIAHVPLQVGVMGGGNDGSRFVPQGSIDCPLAWPQRNSHSRVETLDLRDLQALARLIAAVARDF